MTEFAAFLVRQGVATPGQVLEALDRQSRRKPPIGQVAMRTHLLDTAQVFQILTYQVHHPSRFGEAAIALGLLTQPEVDALLREQHKRTPTLEALLVEAGVLDHEHALALRAQFDGPPTIVRLPRPSARPSGTRRTAQ